MSAMLDAYIRCLLWASTDESRDNGGDPLDDNYGPEDLSREALQRASRDCSQFVASLRPMLRALVAANPEQAGRDLWLTRNGHGAGFWDCPEMWGHRGGKRLTKHAKALGEQHAYAHKGKVHLDL